MEKTLLITSRNCGFFSNFMHIVDNLQWCDDNGYKPVIQLEYRNVLPLHQGWQYSDGRPDVWNYFFKPVSDNIETGQVEYSYFFKLSNYIMHDGWDNGQNKGYIWDLTQQGRTDEILANRKRVHATIEKYIKPSDITAQIINDFKAKHFTGKVLGVHVRGTDYRFHDFDAYVNAIRQYEKDYDKIYVATDNKETITRMKELFGDKVCYYETELRSEKFIDKVVVFNGDVLKTGADHLKHGQDVLVEALLCSSCDRFICINSGVACSVLYLSDPEMPYTMVGRTSIGG